MRMGKKCTKCRVEKGFWEFNRDKRTKDGLNTRCRACCISYMKQYRENNREKMRGYGRKWYHGNTEYARKLYSENIEHYRKRNKKYYIKNKEHIAMLAKKYREKNLEKEKERQKKWYQTNSKRVKETLKEKIKMNRDNLSKTHGTVCKVCGATESKGKNKTLHFHHIEPCTKKSNVATIIHYSWEKVKREAKKCVLLCDKCHKGVHTGKIQLNV